MKKADAASAEILTLALPRGRILDEALPLFAQRASTWAPPRRRAPGAG